MIKFDNESDAREYVNRWVDEQPAEDLRATITDMVLLLFGEETAEIEYALDPNRELQSSADMVGYLISNLRSNLEVDEMLIHAEHGLKAEPGSRYEEDQEAAAEEEA